MRNLLKIPLLMKSHQKKNPRKRVVAQRPVFSVLRTISGIISDSLSPSKRYLEKIRERLEGWALCFKTSLEKFSISPKIRGELALIPLMMTQIANTLKNTLLLFQLNFQNEQTHRNVLQFYNLIIK